ncbi:MAG: hypothetical protein V3U09_03725 [Thermoplasmata archaeon]
MIDNVGRRVMNRKPFPNEEKEESTVMATVLGMTAMFVILLLALYAIVAYYPENGEEDKICPKWWGYDSDYIWKPAILVPPDMAYIDFGKMSPEPKPTSLNIKLMKNGEEIGIYMFQSDDDGELTLKSGIDLGNLTYLDIADNQKVNIGDSIKVTDLSLGSEYVIAMVWADTDECIVTMSFSTPPG